MTRLLGLHPKQHDEHAFQLRSYLDVSATPIPKTHDRKLGNAWGMLGNDQYGDCAFAAKGHALMLWEHVEKRAFSLTAKQVEEDYFAYTGGQDSGTDPDEMMRLWRLTGAYGTPPIKAYLSANLSHAVTDIPRIDYLFGTCILGFALPRAIQADDGAWPAPPYRWQTDPAWQPYSWGGHMTMTHGWTTRGIKQVTWGSSEWFVPNEFLRAYLVAAYAVVSPLWFGPKGHTPQGLNMTALEAELAKLD